MDCNLAARVQLEADVEGLSGKPRESGQHEVMHESRHDLTAHRALQFRHKVVDQESEVKQQHGRHQVDQDPRGFSGLGLPVRRDKQRSQYANISFGCS